MSISPVVDKSTHYASEGISEQFPEIIKIVALLLIGAVFVYYFNFPLSNTIYYSVVLFLFLKSKDTIFWVAFLLIMITNPWGLFYYRTYDGIIPVTATISIPYSSMYGIVFLIKYRQEFRRRLYPVKDYLKRYYKIIGFYAAFLVLLGFVYGHSLASVYRMVIFLPTFFLFLTLPRFFNHDELIRLNKIVLLFVVVHSLIVFFDIITNGIFIKFITFGKPITGAAFTDEIIRILGGIGLNLYGMVIGLYYIFANEMSFRKGYLWIVVLLAYFSIIVSATRGWMIAASFLLFISLIFSVIRSVGNIKSLITFVILASIGFLILPVSIRINLNSAINRLQTVEAIAEGDLSAGGTAIRLTERGPRAVTRFNESPVFGFGYSQVTEEYYDGHVGNHSLLTIGGVLGLLIVYFSIFFLVYYLFRLDFLKIGKGFFVFGLALITIMIIHSSSRAMVSYYFPADSAFIIALFFNHVNAALQKKVQYNELED